MRFFELKCYYLCRNDYSLRFFFFRFGFSFCLSSSIGKPISEDIKEIDEADV